MKKLITLAVLLACCLVSFAADPPGWAAPNAFNPGTFSRECVVYADMRNAQGQTPENISRYTVAAFIDGELHGIAQGTTLYTNDGTKVPHFALRIGGETTDNGKTVEFRLVERDDKGTYLNWYRVQGAAPVKFQAEATVGGTPSNLYHLRFTAPTSVGLSQTVININVGQTLDLLPLLTVTPAGAAVPQDVTFSAGNYVRWFSVENGHVLRGLQANANTPDAMLLTLITPKGGYNEVARVVVHQPITALGLAEGYAEGITVKVGDSGALMQAMAECYRVTPGDATEQPSWSSANTDAISQDAGGTWVPRLAGDYSLLLTASGASLKVPVHIVQPVTALTGTTTEIYVNVGDEVTRLLRVDTKTQPANATHPEVNYSVIAGDANSLQPNNDGTITAIAAGTQTVLASNPDIPNAPVSYTVHVQPKVTAVQVAQETVTVLWKPSATANLMNVTAPVRANFTLQPTDDHHSTFFSMVAADPTVLQVLAQDTGYQVNALKKGTSLLTITRTVRQTEITERDGGNILTNVTRNVSGRFTVNVLSGLTGFTAEPIEMGNTGTYTLSLSPEPADATFDPDLISLSLNYSEAPKGWTLLDIAPADATGLNWTLTPRSLLPYTGLQVSYDGEPLSTVEVNVGQTITLQPGWQWKSLVSGFTKIPPVWNELQEMRTQDDLLYNDDVYGYFGSLQYIDNGQCFKLRGKDGIAAPRDVVIPTLAYDFAHGQLISVGSMWSWRGFAYQYSHPINEVLGMGNSFTEGDRLVSLDGFAEFDGKQWTGTLTEIGGGDGYLFYNAAEGEKRFALPAEGTMPQPTAGGAPAKRLVAPGVWTYNSGRFAGNMTIVAHVPGLAFPADCSIGAFVGEECRGQGKWVDGRFFITVHGEAGETVTFRLYDRSTGECRTLGRELPFADMAGTLARPVGMTPGHTTAINAVKVGSSGIAVTDGQLSIEGLSVKSFRVTTLGGTVVLHNDTNLSQLPSGIYLVTVETTDGRTLTRKVAR